MKKIFLLFSLVVLSIQTHAYDFEVNGLYYNVLNDNEVEVTHKNFSFEEYISGDIEIPQEVNWNGTTYTVVAIGNYAFLGHTQITGIKLPDTVSSIGIQAFGACGFSHIELPDAIYVIGEGAFEGCSLLESITLPVCLISIEDEAFRNCKILRDCVLPFSLLKIGEGAFIGCSSLESVEIPNNVTYLGASAFEYCENLTSVIIGNSVQAIENGTFQGCDNLCNVQIGSSVKKIGEFAFTACFALKSIIIPDSVLEIGRHAFVNCHLSNIHLSNSLIRIGESAFSGNDCETIILPDSLEEIGESAFSNLNFGPQKVYIGKSVKYIGPSAFTIRALENFEISPENQNFACIDGVLFSHNLDTLVCYPGHKGYEYKIPETVNTIGSAAFRFSHIQNVEITNSVKSIKKHAFSNCENLDKINIPKSVLELDESAFQSCSNLKEVTVNGRIGKLKQATFSECTSLSNLRLPNTLLEIEDYSIFGSHNLDTIIIPSSVQSIGFINFIYFGKDVKNNGRIIILNPNLEFNKELFDTWGYNINTFSFPEYYAYGDSYEKLKMLVPEENVFLLNRELLDVDSPVLLGKNSTYNWECIGNLEYASGFQFDITLPEGMSINDISVIKPSPLEIAFTQLSEGEYRILGYTKDASIIGEISLDVEFCSDSRLKEGTILCHNVIMSVQDSQLDCENQTIIVSGYNVNFNLPESLFEGESFTLESPIGDNVKTVSYTFSSQNPNVASIADNKTLNAINEGLANITLSLNDSRFTTTLVNEIAVIAANWGDVDGNGVWNIQDVVLMVNYILGRNPENFEVKLADLDRNGSINIVDLTSLIKIILSQAANEGMKVRHTHNMDLVKDELAFGEITAASSDVYSIPMVISPTESYSALQADIILPEEISLKEIVIGEKLREHILDYAFVGDRKVRMLLYSPSLATISTDEITTLANIILEGNVLLTDKIYADNILCCDIVGNGVILENIESDFTSISGIEDIFNADSHTFDVYSVQGTIVKQNATPCDIETLTPGLYIINGKKLILK